MKDKKLVYILGILVLIVWYFAYKSIRTAVNDSDNDDLPATTVTPSREPFNDFSIPKDTTRLLLNYRDPFGLVKRDTIAPVKATPKAGVIKPVKPAMDWGFIKYSGYIRNPVSKKLVAIMNISGQDVMLAEGEIAGNVKLLKNNRDSVKISFNGKTKFIVMHSATL